MTNATTGFAIAFIGDIICQSYVQNMHTSTDKDAGLSRGVTLDNDKESKMNWLRDSQFTNIDYHRAFIMGGIRAIIIVPFILVWYPFLARIGPGNSIPSIIRRVCVDQTFGSPIVIGLVLGANSLIMNGNIEFDILVKDGQLAWVKGLQYWPFIHAVNFSLFPLHHQALVAHIASIYWNAILSYYSNDSQARK